MKISNTAELGQYVRQMRKAQQLTQQELAVASGVGIRFIVDLEKGKASCQVGKVLAVLQMLGLRIEFAGGSV